LGSGWRAIAPAAACTAPQLIGLDDEGADGRASRNLP
jgi:hypothetical protein